MRDDKWLFGKLDEIWDNYFPDIPQDNDVRIVWGRKAKTRLGSIKQEPSLSQKSKIKDQNDKSKLIKSNFNQNSKFKNQNSSCHPATLITINSLFKDPKIPEYVVEGTIAHELSHYAHGFHSPIKRKFQTPHAGGVVRHELRRRGLEMIYRKQKKWLKENWKEYVSDKFKPPKRRRRIMIKWI